MEVHKFKPVELITKKRNNDTLTDQEIRSFVGRVSVEQPPSAQTGAMLMAMYLNGLSTSETVSLTRAMIYSGEVLSWPREMAHLVVDKHSTGGVGDKVSLVLAPALAVCGLFVPMISGRGLGHTGGTLDKLESIPGFRVQCSSQQIRNMVLQNGCCIVGQTENLVPADKLLYATRDVTGTVDSIPLIIASIMSKKAAEGVKSLVLELTYGRAAVLKTEEEARVLGEHMIKMGKNLGIKTTAVMTRMNMPVGKMIGNSLEVLEAVKALKDEGPEDLVELSVALGSHLLVHTGKADTLANGEQRLRDALRDGSAAARFRAMLCQQGVNKDTAEQLFVTPECALPSSKHVTKITSTSTGYVHGIDGLAAGKLAHALGAGRQKPGESINYAVGVELILQAGSFVEKGECWAKIHHDDLLSEENMRNILSALDVQPLPPPREMLSHVGQALGI